MQQISKLVHFYKSYKITTNVMQYLNTFSACNYGNPCVLNYLKETGKFEIIHKCFRKRNNL